MPPKKRSEDKISIAWEKSLALKKTNETLTTIKVRNQPNKDGIFILYDFHTLFMPRQIPWIKPKIIKLMPAPCHIPAIIIDISEASTASLIVTFEKVLIIGVNK